MIVFINVYPEAWQYNTVYAQQHCDHDGKRKYDSVTNLTKIFLKTRLQITIHI